jgi:hypothetical protein
MPSPRPTAASGPNAMPSLLLIRLGRLGLCRRLVDLGADWISSTRIRPASRYNGRNGRQGSTMGKRALAVASGRILSADTET